MTVILKKKLISKLAIPIILYNTCYEKNIQENYIKNNLK